MPTNKKNKETRFLILIIIILIYISIHFFCVAYVKENDTVEKHLQEAASYSERSRFKDAFTHFQKALKLDPESSEVFYHIGNAYRGMNMQNKAVSAYQQALSTSMKIHNNLGDSLRTQGNLKDAKTHYQITLIIDPNSRPARINLGNILKGEGKLDEAKIHFNHIVTLNPKDTVAIYGLANILIEQGNHNEAMVYLEKVLKLNPDKSIALMAKNKLDALKTK